MKQRRRLGVRRRQWMPVAGLLLALGGCAALPPNSFLDPTKVGRFGWDVQEAGIRRVLTPRETPPGLANATEPTPEDLVPRYEDYRIEAGDVLAVSINDLVQLGTPFSVALEVNSLGEIRLPELGTVKVAGMTEQEVERELKARLIEMHLIEKPVVMVFTQSRRGRLFYVIGAVGNPGAYPIQGVDVRLLDAVAMVGDVSATARHMYVIRREGAVMGEIPAEPPAAEPPNQEWVIPPPEGEPHGNNGQFMTMHGVAWQEAAEPPAQKITKEDLADLLAPPWAQTQPTASEPSEAGGPGLPSMIFDPQTGEVIEGTKAPEAKVTPAAEPAPLNEEDLEEPFDWENVEEYALDQRVIEINLRELRAGNPRYNVVLRNKDVLNVPVDTGVFYLMGEVARPGVYALSDREITIKQALAISGGFSQLAWPQRCEVIRREPGTDKELTIPVNLDAIFAGLEDDFYLRDNDIINVGTHVVAPFLFVVRNSFRFTYGFGFVYDRNFADQDAVGGKPNPETLAIQRRQQRGLPF